MDENPLFNKSSSFSRNPFIEKQLIFYFSYRGTFYGRRMGDERIKVEFLVIHLLFNSGGKVSVDCLYQFPANP